MTTIKSFFVLLVVCLLFGACAPIIYAPTDDVAPVLLEEGEAQIGLSMSTPNDYFTLFSSGGNPSIQLTGAYSPLNNLGLMGQYSRELAIENNITSGLLGIGYYGFFEKNWLFQTYLLGGTENRNLLEVSWYGLSGLSGDLSLNRRSLAIQPSIFYINNNFEIGVTCNYKKNWYRDYEFINVQDEIEYDRADELPTEQRFLEPTFSAAAKFGNMKLQFRYGHSFLIDKNTYEFNPDTYFSTGLFFKI